jgi:hypothetical protein
MTDRALDQFYTQDGVAKLCFAELRRVLDKELCIKTKYWLEPSAGTGSFYSLLPKAKRLGVDLAPKCEGVVEADFLTYTLPRSDYITVGNPPFGKNSSLALKFLNKAGLHSEVVAFIVPNTFKKTSLIKRVNEFLHLHSEMPLKPYSFIFNGKDYDVPCSFQIWVKRPYKRIDSVLETKHLDFEFTTKEKADFAIQRVGANAGRIKKEFNLVSPSSHYFIKAAEDVRIQFEKIDWSKVKHNTAGNPSIAKSEIVLMYNQQLLNV